MKNINIEEIIKILEKIKPYLVESHTTTLLYMTPAQQLRHNADLIEQKEADIKEFTELLSNLKEKGEGK